MAVKGLASLKRKLTRLPDIARAEIVKVMEANADEVVAIAKSLVAVDEGDLRDSIGWTWGEAPKGSMVLGTVRAGRTGNLVITIFAGNDRAFWARWVEFGTASHANEGIFDGTTHPGTRAQPFFYPAYRSIRRKVRGRVSRAINKAAKRAAAGG